LMEVPAPSSRTRTPEEDATWFKYSLFGPETFSMIGYPLARAWSIPTGTVVDSAGAASSAPRPGGPGAATAGTEPAPPSPGGPTALFELAPFEVDMDALSVATHRVAWSTAGCE
jgi:hypothetical protein